MKLLNSATFETDVLQAKEQVIVDFSAPWCGPCKVLEPILNDILKDMPDRIFKVDIDEEPELAKKFKVRSVPTIIVFKGGEVVNQIVGLTTKDKLLKMLNE